MPTIAQLLTAYKDRTGDSYEDMARKVGNEVNKSTMHKLATRPPDQFPKLPRTVELLAELLEVPVTTVVLAFAAGLGIPVSRKGPVLADILPPGTDDLTPEDREAIRTVTRALVDARNAVVHHTAGSGKTESTVGRLINLARPPMPDLTQVAARRGESEGRRLRDEQDADGEAP